MAGQQTKTIARAKRLVASLSPGERLQLWRYLADLLGEKAALEWEDRFLATSATVQAEVQAALEQHARGEFVTAEALKRQARRRGNA